uniref:DNA-directed RNA polymerase n=1 Tax=Chlamydomonas leiostraca TaxID=1034604 RepID=A0A1L2M574_9CHLO|nr:RNA polymerase beta subunit 2 [Chlamydomonas leiostraca]APD80616.1 RNA polymerase beta subunit 2 [Chlamydomonas leiostraca]
MNSTKSVFLRSFSKKRTAASGSPTGSLTPSILLTLGPRKGFASPLPEGQTTGGHLTQAGGVLGITQNELESIAFSPTGNSGPDLGPKGRKEGRKTKRYKFIPTEYKLDSFQRSNQDTCITHKPAVFEGDWVQAGDILTDCASSVGGELSLGQNLLIAYLPWEGYNFEDAILISERLVIDDLYTSVHIERYEMEVNQTALGPEEITRDIPDVSDSEVENLDSFGIVKVGTWVEEGDILVGKITPIQKNTISPYQKLLYTILEKKVRPFRDTSLRAPKGVKAKVIDIKFFNKANGIAPFQSMFVSPEGKEGDSQTQQLMPGLAEAGKIPPTANKKRKTKKSSTSTLSKTQANNLRKSRAVTSGPEGLGENNAFDLYSAWLGQQPSLYTRLAYNLSRLQPRRQTRLGGPTGQTGSAYHKQPLLNGLNNYFSTLKKVKLSRDPSTDRFWDNTNNSFEQINSKRSVGLKRTLGKKVKTKKLKNVFSFSPISYRTSTSSSRVALRGPLGAQETPGTPGTEVVRPRFSLAQLRKDSSSTPLPNVFKLPKLSKSGPSLLGPTGGHASTALKGGPASALNIKNIETIHIYLAETRKIQVGDKMSGRHGNKGIVSNILPIQDMPYLPDGTPIDMVLNPLGVPSRMNVGQIYECLLGLAGRYLGENYKVSCFDEIYGPDASRSFVFNKLYEASKTTGLNWLFDPNTPGKVRIYDGRTGDSFDQAVTVGHAYILRLVHMVDDKIHMRSTGPYSLVTQQPLRGRSKEGGQRLGEMEVWALEGYGAAFTLLEMLTIKSDDMTGRMTLWSNLILNKDISIGTPESFKVLICELQALCLDIGLFRYGTNGEARTDSINRHLTEIDSLINLP